MSHEKQTKLRKLIGIDMYTDVAFVLAAGSVEVADKWGKLMTFLAEHSNSSATDEMGFEDAALLTEDFFDLHWQTFRTLKHMGIAWPQTFPAELEKIDYELLAWWRSDSPEEAGDEESDSDAFWTLQIVHGCVCIFYCEPSLLDLQRSQRGWVGRHRVKPLGTRRD
jgi:hypothetical protein